MSKHTRILAATATTALAASVTAAVVAMPAPAGAATPTYSTIAFDPMNRSVQRGLGSAPTGGPYAITRSTTHTRVVPGRASITNLKPGASARATLGRVAVTDSVVRLVITPRQLARKGSGTLVAAELRRRGDGSAYRGRVRMARGGKLLLSFSRVVHNTETRLGGERALRFTSRNGRSLTLQVSVTGTSTVQLRATAWPTGSRQPAVQAGVDDRSGRALRRAGSVGWWVYQSRTSPTSWLDVRQLIGWVVRRTGSLPSTPKPPVPPVPPVTTPAPPVTTPAPTEPTTPAPSEPTTPAPSEPTTPAPSEPTPAPDSTAGSVPVGEARYAAPSDALYVSSTQGDDAAAGSVTAPMRTVQAALKRARYGQTIVLRAGSYHENVFVADKSSVTIQNYPGEAVWFDGSVPVTDWTRRGNTWVATGWTAAFDHSASFSKGSDAGKFVSAEHPLAAYPDQVFVDGQQLTQVAAGTTPAAGQFAVDTTAKTLTIGSDPTGHEVRGSDLQQGFLVAGGNVTLRGFGVRRYATSLWQLGAVFFGGKIGNEKVENLVIEQNATQGLSVCVKNSTVSHVTVRSNGYSGIHANKASGLTVQYSSMSDNNTALFNTWPSGGDLKVTRTDGFVARGNETRSDTMLGIWTDVSVSNFTIVGNRVTGATPYGILVELSQAGVVADNVVENADRGITLLDSGQVTVTNNRLRNNQLWDIGLNQDARWKTYNADMACPGVAGGTCTWKVQSVVIAGNVTGRARNQVYVLDNRSNVAADNMDITIAGNVFTTAPSGSHMVAWGLGDNRSFAFLESPAALKAKNSRWINSLG